VPRSLAGRAAAALAAALLPAAPRAAAPALDAATYTVQPGDSCVAIARRLWGDPKAISRLHDFNPGMGPTPHHLVPGTVLRVQEPPVAEVTALRPDVNARRAGGAGWRPAARGLGLYRLDELATLAGAGAEVTFLDDTRLRLRENVLVVIYGPPAPSLPQSRKSGAVELVQGELRLSLAALRGEPVRLATPGATVAARSRDMHVAVDAASTSRVSVLDGRAAVRALGKEVQVAEGQGTRVEKGKAPEPPRLLPAAPAWSDAAHAVRLAVDGQGAEEALAWSEVPGAAGYRLELARDPGFVDLVRDERRPAGQERRVAVSLPPGSTFAQVRAVDASGLVGRASAVRRLDVVRIRVERGEVGPDGIGGQGEVRLAVETGPELEATLDGKPAPAALSVKEPGRHLLRVAPRGSPDARGAELALLVRAEPPPPAPPAPAPPPAAPPPIPVSLAPALGSPAQPLLPLALGGPFLPTQPGTVDASVQPDGGSGAGGRGAGICLSVSGEARVSARGALAVALAGRSPTEGGPSQVAAGAAGRVALVEGGPFRAALGLDVAALSASGGEGIVRARPSLALGLRAGSMALSTAQGLGLELRGGRGRSWDSAWVVAWQPVADLALAAELHGIRGELGGRSLSAWAAGGALRSRLAGGWEVAVGGRAGFSPQGEERWGRWSALLSIGYRAGEAR